MVVIERAGSFSSSTSSRKEKKSGSCEKDSNEVLKKKLLRKTSSSSSPCTPSKKEKQSGSCLKDNHEVLKGKLAERADSISSPSSPCIRKGKQKMMSTQKDVNNEVRKERPVRKASSLSSPCNSFTKKSKSSTSSERNQKSNTMMKSRVKELAPICKKRKEILNSIKVEEDIDVYLDKQIEQEGKENADDCLWLSSGSMSPQEFGLFMSALDPCLDEWVLSFLPRSSRTPNGKTTSASVCEAKKSGEVEEEEVAHEVNGSSLERSQSIESSSCSSSIALSTHTDSSTFWNMDRTGVWVSLINDVNQTGEDSEFISNVESQLKDLESNFHEIDWDSYSSDVGVSSSAKSTQESASQSEWSSDLLSDSMDWELDSDDPIFWPLGVDCDWDHQDLDSFSVSPRKGVYKIRLNSREDGCVTPDSIRFRLHGRNGKRILFMSGLSASKIIEFKKGCRKNAATTAAAATTARGKRLSKIGKRASRYKRRVPPILENDLEGISPKETPKESLKTCNNSSDIDLSECTDHWGDEMESDGPLVWPTDQNTDWNLTWDSFDISPRRNTQVTTNLSSPKGGFTVSSSVRLKFRPKNLKSKAVCNTKSGLGTSKSSSSMFKSNNVLFKHGRQGKKNKDLPLKDGKSIKEFIRLVSLIGMNKMFPGNEQTSEDQLPIETLLGLTEFDGHEGVDMEFEDEDLSLE
ncbi:hypothetical protein BVRB_3g054930 [Beta vulgaris subsp. vulgaris]|nr:hypothetical protein BVRB_3g054930 [Beta vulgaris subsp. vulgaris]